MAAKSIKKIGLSVFLLVCSLQVNVLFGNEIIRSGVSSYNLQGLERQITELTAQLIGGTLEMKNYPFKRRLLMMQRGRMDFMVGLFKRPEREEYIYFLSQPYKRRSNRVFFVLKATGIKIKNYEDLYGLSIATTIGTKYFKKFDTDPKIKKRNVSKVASSFKMLLKHRVDAVICSDSAGILNANKLGIIDKVEIADYQYSNDNPVYIGISKKSHLMKRIDEIEDVFNQALEEGKYDQLMIRYYTDRNLPVPRYK